MVKQPITQSALLVVDAQESFKVRGPEFWETRGPEGFEENLKQLVTGYREAGLPVYFILHSDNDPGFQRTCPEYRVMDFLDYQPHELLIHKTVHNSFTGTDLEKQLRAQNISRLIVTGIRTEQCCETTTRVGSDLGFDMDFVPEATLTFPIAHPNGTEHLSVADIVERTTYVLRDRFARITSVASILEEMKVECKI